MCGRATLSTPPDDLRDLFGLDEMPPLIPRYNIAPTQPIAIIRSPKRLELVRWGLVPSGGRELSKGTRGINVRVETITRVPAYRSSFRARRCLVVVDGFFEWQRDGKIRKPFLIQRPDHKPFALAGIWDRVVTADGEVIESCAIITGEAAGVVATLHDRMPLIVTPDRWASWLDGRTEHAEALLAPLLHPERALALVTLVTQRVSTLVNNPANDDPRCLEPVEPGVLVGENRSLF